MRNGDIFQGFSLETMDSWPDRCRSVLLRETKHPHCLGELVCWSFILVPTPSQAPGFGKSTRVRKEEFNRRAKSGHFRVGKERTCSSSRCHDVSF